MGDETEAVGFERAAQRRQHVARVRRLAPAVESPCLISSVSCARDIRGRGRHARRRTKQRLLARRLDALARQSVEASKRRTGSESLRAQLLGAQFKSAAFGAAAAPKWRDRAKAHVITRAKKRTRNHEADTPRRARRQPQLRLKKRRRTQKRRAKPPSRPRSTTAKPKHRIRDRRRASTHSANDQGRPLRGSMAQRPQRCQPSTHRQHGAVALNRQFGKLQRQCSVSSWLSLATRSNASPEFLIRY